ncbi:Cullin-4B [Podospora aff. communis PSN243]|uniref:Cullin-4B n=1 Tax=Podospora aff. communis PSN243 TaxID=3040156 RepID=A0AAV9H5Z7_9PEZI|nr:Cullin-4B [Podospora aff. communis PSN243]
MPPTTAPRPPTSATSATPTTSASQPPHKRRHDATTHQAPTSTSSSGADTKRARSGTFHTSPHPRPVVPTPTLATMSAKVQGKRPVSEVIDLTGPSSSSNLVSQAGGAATSSSSAARRHVSVLPSHIGPRKLVVKNFRPATAARAQGVDEYYARTREELQDALAAIFSGRPTAQPMERLYRGVEDICRKGEAAELAEALKRRCEVYLGGEAMLGGVGGGGDIAVLRAVLERWGRWRKGGRGKPLVGINDMGIGLFRAVVFGSRKDTEAAALGERVLSAMCELVEYDRTGDERFESGLLKESVAMLRLFGVYGKFFERRFLSESHEYFSRFAHERNDSDGLKDYIIACESLLHREGERCDLYNFDSATKRQLRDDAHRTLVEKYSEKLLDSGSVGRLLDANDVESMKALYDLLKLSSIQKQLKGPWEDYIRATGSAIVSDKARGDDMVIRLLELRRSLDIMIRDAFGKDEVFSYGLREAFGAFINDKKNTAVWQTGPSKVGEMIAKYVDMLLRGGLKTLPKTLLSDKKDRADAEMSGVAITGDEDAELDRQLDSGIELFRFIEGKDVFEAFYKKDLARRLLMGRSASQDAERNMLSKLKSECGSSFTHNLEQMFKDQELGRDEMASYKEWFAGTGRSKSGMDLNVSILSAAAWPTYPDTVLFLPKDVVDHINSFDTYYRSKHTGRRLTWKHNLAHCVIRAQFDRGPKELLVSALQAVVLLLFNEAEGKGGPTDGVLAYQQISKSTGLQGGELERTLQSLACGKARVLNKHPKGRDVKPTDTFTVNKAFVDPKFRVKINQIQLKESKEENQETHKRVAADRQFETQAAIVRIMKSRKTMTHSQLVAEVINQTKNRGAVDAADIKLNIEKLIEKDYIEREDGQYVYMA